MFISKTTFWECILGTLRDTLTCQPPVHKTIPTHTLSCPYPIRHAPGGPRRVRGDAMPHSLGLWCRLEARSSEAARRESCMCSNPYCDGGGELGHIRRARRRRPRRADERGGIPSVPSLPVAAGERRPAARPLSLPGSRVG